MYISFSYPKLVDILRSATQIVGHVRLVLTKETAFYNDIMRLRIVHIQINNRRKFRSHTSDKMDMTSRDAKSQRREEKRRGEKRSEEKRSEEKRSEAKRREEKRREERRSKRENLRRKKIQVRAKVGKSRNTLFFK